MKKIYVAVTGDLFHHGHISFFKKARAFGNYLVVGVHSDEDVAVFKWPHILNLNERFSLLEEGDMTMMEKVTCNSDIYFFHDSIFVILENVFSQDSQVFL